jgi:hypothetical protein
MTLREGAWLLLLSGCSLWLGRGSLGCGPPAVPPGPPPEYERPRLEPWDAAPAADPFDLAEAQADWVDEGPEPDAGPAAEDAGPPAPGAADAGGNDAGQKTEPNERSGPHGEEAEPPRDAERAPGEP